MVHFEVLSIPLAEEVEGSNKNTVGICANLVEIRTEFFPVISIESYAPRNLLGRMGCI
jgi:hypothetical protein